MAGCAMLAVPISVVGWLGVKLADGLPEAAWVSGVTMQSFYGWAALLLAVGVARDFAAVRPQRRNADAIPAAKLPRTVLAP